MSDEATFLRAVLQSPDDDGPRLDYAGWCEQQSDPRWQARSRFVRAQLEKARLPPDAPQDKKNDLAYIIRTTEKAYRHAWAEGIGSLVDEFGFDRGFVELVTIDAGDFISRAPQFFNLSPIRHINLTAKTGFPREILVSPLFAGVRSLSLDRCGLTDAELKQWAENPAVADIVWLSLAENHLGLEGARALAESPFTKGLSYVNLYGNPLNPGEIHSMDDGNIVANWLPPEGLLLESWYGRLPWLHAAGSTVWDMVPSRFRVTAPA